jgi:hypothetical protein
MGSLSCAKANLERPFCDTLLDYLKAKDDERLSLANKLLNVGCLVPTNAHKGFNDNGTPKHEQCFTRQTIHKTRPARNELWDLTNICCIWCGTRSTGWHKFNHGKRQTD